MKAEYIPLLRKGVEWVEEQEKLDPMTREWVQSDWIIDPLDRTEEYGHAVECGTGRCLAGYLGYQLDPVAFKDTWELEDGRDVADYVQDAMGIDPFVDNQYLWNGSNDAATIRSIAEQIAGEPL